MFKKLLITLAFLVCLPLTANAATCFWVGGTGNWDNSNTASWASGTGGTPGTCAATGNIPKNSTDIATFDASSCGSSCTITVCGGASANCPSASGSLNLGATGQIVWGACTNTCTIDFSAINPTVSIGSFNGSGTGTRTLKMGSGAWTVQGTGSPWNMTTTTNCIAGACIVAGSSTLNLIPSSVAVSSNYIMGGQTYNNVNFAPGSAMTLQMNITGANTFANFSCSNIQFIKFPAGATNTINGTWSCDGGSGTKMLMTADGTGSATLSMANANTSSWMGVQRLTVSGAGSFTVNNGFDFGGNSNVTINAPASSGGFVIGGG